MWLDSLLLEMVIIWQLSGISYQPKVDCYPDQAQTDLLFTGIEHPHF